MRGKRGIRVFMLSPHGKMSPFQTAQMFTAGPEHPNIAIRGVFDDCQDIVKAVSNDLVFKQKHRIGAVNSINWARIAAQIVYYFKGYFRHPSDDEQVSFSVPSGNFGNICAGHVARKMGLPISKLIVATNENDVLDEFFRPAAIVRGDSETLHTSSPSMDIARPQLRALRLRPAGTRRCAPPENCSRAAFRSPTVAFTSAPGCSPASPTSASSRPSTHANRLETIRSTGQRCGTMIDPHTADGLKLGVEHAATRRADGHAGDRAAGEVR